MTLDKLAVDMRVPNYKELCKLLDEPVKAGNSKKAQLKDFEKYFAYKKDGNAFIITQIYDVPLTKDDGRQKYLPLLEPIILNYLAMYPDYNVEKWSTWFQVLGMVNADLYDESRNEKEQEFWRTNSYSLFLLRNIAKNKMKEILSSTLANMKKRGLLDYHEYWCIVSKNGFSHLLEEKYEVLVTRVHQEVLAEMGCSNLSAVYLSPKKIKEFEAKTHEKFLEAGWRNVFKVVTIAAVSDIKNKYAGIDAEPLKAKLNKKVCSAVVKAAHTMAENAENKDWKKLDSFNDEDWEAYRAVAFSLPQSFAMDVDVLVEQLMKRG